MEPDDNFSLEGIKLALGKKLIGFRRMFFYFEDQVVTDTARTELEFEGGLILFFRGIGGGSNLKIVPEAWLDEYAHFSTEEIEKVKYEFGLQRRVELIRDLPYADYQNRKLVSIVPMTNEFDYLLGVELEFEEMPTKITIFTSWDENYVVLGEDSHLLSHAHLTLRLDLKSCLSIESKNGI